MLALMASGLQGQRFAFRGYLPAAKRDREQQLGMLEAESQHRDETQIFIETPYRNLQLFESVVACCGSHTLLCVASDLTGSGEQVTTRPVAHWRRSTRPALAKRPTVFLLYAPRGSAQRRR
jgi:16S rRNA (cytidine1402-2'-O)-methyltransferase